MNPAKKNVVLIYRPLLILALPFLGLLIVNLFLPNRPIKDELLFWPVIQNFGTSFLPSLEQVKNIHSPMGPVSFVFWGMAGKLCGFSLPAMRSLNIIVGYGVVLIIYRILQRFTGMGLAWSLWFTLNPYFLLLVTPLLYTENISLVFFFLGAYFYLNRENRLLSSLCWGIAVCSRQLLVFAPLAAIITDLIRFRTDLRLAARFTVLNLLPFFMFSLLFALWGFSVKSPAAGIFEENSLEAFRFSLKALNYSILLLAVYALPLWLTTFGKTIKSGAFKASLLLSAGLIVAFPWMINAGMIYGSLPPTAGYLDKALCRLGAWAWVLVPAVWVPGAGWLLAGIFSRTSDRYSLFARTAVSLFLILESTYAYCWDKHFIPVIIFLFLMNPASRQPGRT